MKNILRILVAVAALLLIAVAFAVSSIARSGPSTPAAATTTFIFWPGGVADVSTSVYTDWTDLYVAASAVTNPTVVVDDTIEDAEVPAGTWVLDGWTLTTDRFSTLYFTDGAAVVLHYNLTVDQGLTIQSEAVSVPTLTAPVGYYASIFLRGGSFMWNTATATAPFIYVPSGGWVMLSVEEASIAEVPSAYYPGNSAGPLIECATSGGWCADVIVGPNSTFGPYSLGGAGWIQVVWNQITAGVYTTGR